MATPDYGSGVSPSGSSSFGIGQPATGDAPAKGLYITASGEQGTGRFIDPVARQYTYDAQGRAVGEMTVPQMVKLVALTTKGSSAMASLGTTISSVKDITSNFVQRVNAIYTDAYSAMTSAGLIKLLPIEVVDPGSGVGLNRRLIKVHYVDLSDGQKKSETV